MIFLVPVLFWGLKQKKLESVLPQLLRRQQTHATIVHDVGGPLNVDTHAHDTNMLVDNDVIENVVAIITTGVLEDILTPVHK
jgi:hypothetical protein